MASSQRVKTLKKTHKNEFDPNNHKKGSYKIFEEGTISFEEPTKVIHILKKPEHGKFIVKKSNPGSKQSITQITQDKCHHWQSVARIW